MKWFFLLAAALVSASAADLSGIKTVYILPMANSLDQYLAIKLTTGLVLQVVTDPQKADGILSDSVGANLEDKLDEFYGAKQKADTSDPFATQKPMVKATARARGAIFLIDRKTRNVIWSDYEKPRNTTPGAMNAMAEKIASKLNKDVKAN